MIGVIKGKNEDKKPKNIVDGGMGNFSKTFVLGNFKSCHSCESGNPETLGQIHNDWIPDQVGNDVVGNLMGR